MRKFIRNHFSAYLRNVSPWTVRITVFIVLVSTTSGVVGGFEIVLGTDQNIYQEQAELQPSEREQIAGVRDNRTVLTFSGNGPMVLVNRNGTLGYYTDAYDSFWDVDPVPGSKSTVLVGASDEYDVDQCPGNGACTRNYVIRWNLTTGDRMVLVDRFRPLLRGSEWHDFDLVSESKDGSMVLVADIEQSRIMKINTTTGLTTWSYAFQEDYSLQTGGQYPGGSWTHLNDVEQISGDRVMASPRNFDSVIFIGPDGELNESWTLGEDGDHSILYEQHNPDYIPKSNGGPAVIIADSQNNRIVEYQRTNGSWEEAWVWRDGRMKWPRDADRLPNGNTLITDTNANRFVEVNSSGSIVWTHGSPDGLNPYEAERLGTGDESTGGSSATQAGLNSRQPQVSNGDSGGFSIEHPWRKLWTTSKDILPNKIVNALLFVKPAWLTSADLPLLFIQIGVLLGLVVYEVQRMSISMRVQSPLIIRRD